MSFNPGIDIGDELTNEEMQSVFKCGNMGGMRRSKKTGTLVIISDYTKKLYQDIWKNGVLYYTGTGKNGNQTLYKTQNSTLYYSDTNGVEVHLFEVLKKSVYTYCGVVKLVDKPFKSKQPDYNGCMREVWIFPVTPIVDYKKIEECELCEKEISKLSDMDLARYASLKNIKRVPKKAEAFVYYRDPYLKRMVKRIANGKCQYCRNDAPFMDKQGEPYLEEHHVTRLADGGEDTMENLVALCPNCHRKIHVLSENNDTRILESIGIDNKRKLERILGIVEVFESKNK